MRPSHSKSRPDLAGGAADRVEVTHHEARRLARCDAFERVGKRLALAARDLTEHVVQRPAAPLALLDDRRLLDHRPLGLLGPATGRHVAHHPSARLGLGSAPAAAGPPGVERRHQEETQERGCHSGPPTPFEGLRRCCMLTAACGSRRNPSLRLAGRCRGPHHETRSGRSGTWSSTACASWIPRPRRERARSSAGGARRRSP